MTFGFCPFKNTNGTDFEADAVACADIPVNCNVCSVYAKLLGRLNWTPNVVTLMLGYDFAAFLEVWIYRHHSSPVK